MANQNNDEVSIQHRELMEEEGLETKDLPREIQKQIKDFDVKLKIYEETEDDDEENKLFNELRQDDVKIADNIQNWLEDNNSDDDDDEEEDYDIDEDDEDEDEKKVVNNQNQQNKPKVEQPTKQPQPQPQQQQQQQPQKQQQQPVASNKTNTDTPPAKSVEQKIQESIVNNVIPVVKLTEIIGAEPDYPEHQVGSLRLRKQYLKPFYELIS